MGLLMWTLLVSQYLKKEKSDQRNKKKEHEFMKYPFQEEERGVLLLQGLWGPVRRPFPSSPHRGTTPTTH